jgi:DNA-binding transcriptional regulator of glucitol operon
MAVTTRQPGAPAGARWHALLRPRWLVWHAFVVSATVGMFFLGDWQLRRAESGNSLSWAYTFEWPLFAAFTVYFWIKSLRDELRGQGATSVDSGAAATAAPVAEMTTGAAVSGAEAGHSAPGPQPASWDATSWDATSWGATSREADANGTGKPVDRGRATPADGEAYVARLMAEVRGPGRRRGRR